MTRSVKGFGVVLAAVLVLPIAIVGGTFLYATCSVFPAENGEQIDALLHRHGDAREVSRAQLLPGEEHDGFFYAVLVKQG